MFDLDFWNIYNEQMSLIANNEYDKLARQYLHNYIMVHFDGNYDFDLNLRTRFNLTQCEIQETNEERFNHLIDALGSELDVNLDGVKKLFYCPVFSDEDYRAVSIALRRVHSDNEVVPYGNRYLCICYGKKKFDYMTDDMSDINGRRNAVGTCLINIDDPNYMVFTYTTWNLTPLGYRYADSKIL